MRTPTTPMPVSPREQLEATVAEYHHVQGEHRRAGAGGRVRRHLHARLGRLEGHFERLLEESVADEVTRDEWRHHLHHHTPAPAEPRAPTPALLFRGRAETGSVAEVRQRADGDCDVFVDGAHLERVAAKELAEGELPLTFRIDHQEFREIFEAPARALAAARAYFSDPSGEPPWHHATALVGDGLVDGTFALTPRGRRALGARRTGSWPPS